MQLKQVSNNCYAVLKMKITDRKHLTRAALVTALVAATAASPAASPSSVGTGKRPNIVIILGDDLGFSDMGCFGSEIKTPNLDSLAKAGVRCTQFYTSASCSPTRSMLLSGVDTHLNGLGNMDEWAAPNQWGVDGYEGYLNKRVATLPQLLKDAGYHTYMAGKWHMGKSPDKIPAARGFERDFSLLDGAGSYWDMANFTAANPRSTFTEDGRYLKKLPGNYYATIQSDLKPALEHYTKATAIDLEAHVRYELASIMKAFQTHDAGEARKAFFEKRQPVFEGR